MFTLCILFSTLTTKAGGICKGALKQFPDLKIHPVRGLRPLVLKFLDPPLLTFIRFYCFSGASIGMEPWEVVRSLCPYPGNKIIQINHIARR